MKIAIIGTSRITANHIQVLKNQKINIASICSTRKNSKKLKKLASKFKIKTIFKDWKKSIKYALRFKDCNFLITSRMQDNYKVLNECVKTNRYIFIEKPVFLKSNEFNKFMKYKKKIFIGYNRIFYKIARILKNKLKNKSTINVIVKCPESNRSEITKNSCHILSILFYLFGSFKIKNKKVNKNFINCSFIIKNNIFLNIFFNFKNYDNFGIEIYDSKYRYLLSPIENLKIFTGIKKIKNNNNYIYYPKISKEFNEYNQNKYKPGFKNQLIEFIKFSNGGKIINDLDFGKKIVKLCESITK